MSGPSPKIVRVISELSIAQLRDDSSNLSVGLSDNRVQAILNSHEALRQHLTESEARFASQGEQIAQLTKAITQWEEWDEMLRQKVDDYQWDIGQLERQSTVLRQRTAELEADLAAALAARDEAERRKVRLRTAYDNLRAEELHVFGGYAIHSGRAGQEMEALLDAVKALITDPSADPPKEQA